MLLLTVQTPDNFLQILVPKSLNTDNKNQNSETQSYKWDTNEHWEEKIQRETRLDPKNTSF